MSPSRTILGSGVVVLLGVGAYLAFTSSGNRDRAVAENPAAGLAATAPSISQRADDASPSPQDTGSAQPIPDAAKQSDLALRLTACLSNPSDDERSLEFLKQLSEMKSGDAPEFLKALEEFRKQGVRREEWSAFFRKWGEIDPASAIAFLDKNSAESWAPNSYQQVLRSWGIKDATRAQAWLNERSGEKYFDEAFLGFLEGYATWDSKSATQTALASLEGGSDRLINSAMEKIATSVFRTSYASGLKDWFDALPSEGDAVAFRKGAVNHVYTRLLQKDPADAAEWVSAQATTPWRSDRIIGDLAARLAERDPATAMKWVSGMPPSPRIGVIMGVGEIVRVWSRDPATFEPWLETARGTQVFEQAARDYAIEIARKDPQRAMHYATQVTNAHWRGEAIAAAQSAGAK